MEDAQAARVRKHAVNLPAASFSDHSCVYLQEVEQLRLERLQIDEQLRQLTQGHRAGDRERDERGDREGYNTDGSANASSSLHLSRTYNGRGRGRRGHNPGYGRHLPAQGGVRESCSDL